MYPALIVFCTAECVVKRKIMFAVLRLVLIILDILNRRKTATWSVQQVFSFSETDVIAQCDVLLLGRIPIPHETPEMVRELQLTQTIVIFPYFHRLSPILLSAKCEGRPQGTTFPHLFSLFPIQQLLLQKRLMYSRIISVEYSTPDGLR